MRQNPEALISPSLLSFPLFEVLSSPPPSTIRAAVEAFSVPLTRETGHNRARLSPLLFCSCLFESPLLSSFYLQRL